jgi:hypothetical protein
VSTGVVLSVRVASSSSRSLFTLLDTFRSRDPCESGDPWDEGTLKVFPRRGGDETRGSFWSPFVAE